MWSNLKIQMRELNSIEIKQNSGPLKHLQE